MKLRWPQAEAAQSYTTKNRLRGSKETAAKSSMEGFLGLNPCISAIKAMLSNWFNKIQQITTSQSPMMTNKIRLLVSGQGSTQKSSGNHPSSSSQLLRRISNKSTIKQSLMWTRCQVRMNVSSPRKVKTFSSRSRTNPNNPQTSWILLATSSLKLLTTDQSLRCLFLKLNWPIVMMHLREIGIKNLTINKMSL